MEIYFFETGEIKRHTLRVNFGKIKKKKLVYSVVVLHPKSNLQKKKTFFTSGKIQMAWPPIFVSFIISNLTATSIIQNYL